MLQQNINTQTPKLTLNQSNKSFTNERGIHICFESQTALYNQKMGVAAYNQQVDKYIDYAGNAYQANGVYAGHLYNLNNFTTPADKAVIKTQVEAIANAGNNTLGGNGLGRVASAATSGLAGGGILAGHEANAVVNKPAAKKEYTMSELIALSNGNNDVLTSLLQVYDIKPEKAPVTTPGLSGVLGDTASTGLDIDDILDLNSDMNGGISNKKVTGNTNTQIQDNTSDLGLGGVTSDNVDTNLDALSNSAIKEQIASEKLKLELNRLKKENEEVIKPTTRNEPTPIVRCPTASKNNYNFTKSTKQVDVGTETITEALNKTVNVELGSLESELISLTPNGASEFNLITTKVYFEVIGYKALEELLSGSDFKFNSIILYFKNIISELKGISILDVKDEELIPVIKEYVELKKSGLISGTDISIGRVETSYGYILASNDDLYKHIGQFEVNGGCPMNSFMSTIVQQAMKQYEDPFIIKVLDREVRITPRRLGGNKVNLRSTRIK